MSKIKKLMGVLLCCMLFCCLSAASAFAAKNTFLFDEASGRLDIANDTGITDTLGGTAVSKTSIKELIIGGDVTSLPADVFIGLTNLEAIKFEASDTVLTITDKAETAAFGAFADSTLLSTITINRSISFGDGAFGFSADAPNTVLKTISFTENVTLGDHCFENCTALETVTFAKNVTAGESCFFNVPVLEGVAFNGTSNTLGRGMFSCSATAPNTKLTTLTFPAGTSFGAGVFTNYNVLESITFNGDADVSAGSCFGYVPELKTLIFNGASKIGSGAFSESTKLETMTFASAKTLEFTSGAFIYTSEKPNTALTTLSFPVNTTFSAYIFHYFNALESITFNGNVDVSGGSCFANNLSIKTLDFKGTSNIANGAFGGATNIASISFGGATSIGINIFSYLSTAPNTALTELSFPEGSTFGAGAFGYCTALKKITFNGDADVSAGSCFGNATALETLIFNGESIIQNGAFTDATKLATITFTEKTSLGYGVLYFAGDKPNTALTELSFPAGSTFISGAVAYLNALEKITFLGDVSLSYGGIFSDLPNLKTLDFKGTSVIASGVFGRTQKLATITFGGKTQIGDGVFGYNASTPNTGLTELSFPVGSTFGASVFSYCNALKKVTFNGDVELTGGNCFSNDPELTTLDFKGESDIKNDAFKGTTKLATITFGGKTSVGNGAFCYNEASPNTALTELSFPIGSTFIGDSFRYFNALEKITFLGDIDITAGSIFAYLPNLTTLDFKGESKLGATAFKGTTKLATITFGGKTKIGIGIFEYSTSAPNTGLTELSFPAGSTFGGNVFSYCNALEKVTFNGDVELTSGNCFAYNSELTTIDFKGTSKLSSGAFDGTTKLATLSFGGKTEIGYGIFKYSSSKPNTVLTELSFPAGSTFKGDTFQYLNALKKVTFNGDVELTSGNCFAYNSELTTIDFKGTSKLSSSAFDGTTKLATLSFGDKTEISYGIFEYSSSKPNTVLTELSFPAGSTFKGDTFQYLNALKKVTFNGDVELTSGNCFAYNSELTTIDFKGTSNLSSSAFAGSTKLATLSFGGKTEIGYGIFEYSSSKPNTVLTELSFPAGSTFKGDTFQYLNALKKVTFNGDVELTSGNCFAYNSELITIDFKGTSKLSSSAFVGSTKLATLSFGGKTEIGNTVFCYNSENPNTGLTELSFPADSTFGKNVFNYCNALKKVTFNGDVELTSGNCFADNSEITTIDFKGTSKLSNSAFNRTKKLATITFGGKTELGSGIFGYSSDPNTALKELTFPAGSTFSSSVFSYCNALEKITFNGDAVITSGSVFASLPNLKTLDFKGTSKISSGAFTATKNLATITFGGKTEIGDGIFNYYSDPNTKLKELSFPEGSTFGASCFNCCSALEKITFNGDATVAYGSFSNLTNLKTLDFKAKSNINYSAFGGATKLATISFGDATTIGSSIFSYSPSVPNTALKELTFPAGSTFGSGCFYDCHALEKITFNDNVTVSSGSFGNLSNLKTLDFKGESNLSTGVFAGSTKLATITFGGKTNVGGGAFFYSEEAPNTALKELSFPTGSVFNSGCFSYCSALEKITFNGDADLSSASVFNNLPKLDTVDFKGTSKISEYALSGVPKLKKIIFGGKTDLKEKALLEAGTSLANGMDAIVIPAGSTVAANAFEGANITSVEFTDITPPAIGKDAFKDCPEDAIIYVPCTAVEAYTAVLNAEENTPNPNGLEIVGKHVLPNDYSKNDDHHWKVCGRCTAEIGKTEHCFGDWSTTKTPSTSEYGERECVCDTCGHKKIEPIDKLPAPATGDETEILLFALLMLVSAAMLMGTVVYKRKRATR